MNPIANRPHVDEEDLAPEWMRGATRDVTAEQWEQFEAYVGEIFTAFGMELDTPGTVDTPRRFLRALFDSTSGYDGDRKLLTAFPSERSTTCAHQPPGQIIEGPIAFAALCEHHALPFHGVVTIGYVPSDRIIGISKLTRLVRLYARRFTVQERMGEQIADLLAELVDAEGVAVRIAASHMCTQMRGVEEHSLTTTTVWRGCYQDADLRREFLQQSSDARR